ncbi:MAG: MBOAT family protein [Lachnospiraceae bacterium]|nr:MBOAT family protein [Lachnospiraceae bacterium]
MVFSSLLFLFAFLTVQLIPYYLVKSVKAKNVILLAFSLVFYAWGGPKYLILLVLESLISYLTAREIGKTEFKTMKKRWLILDVVLLLSLLAVFKYTGFFLSNIQFIFHWPKELPEILLPIGISFYTFQLISYVADVYRGEVEPQPKFWKVLLYSSLVHQCIAGPIVRYKTVASEIDERSIEISDVFAGIRRFSVGLAKKAILANGCAAVADALLPLDRLTAASASGPALWLGMAAYMLQIYLDFSAYSDMAIGMGRMVGFHYLENFDYPYTASTVQGFWRKWHISLSSFFRDYVYIPLGGNRKGLGRTILNMFVVWFLTGFWHGASWNFILWGLYFFVFLMLERFFLGRILQKNLVTRVIGHFYTLFVVFLGWVLFKFNDMGIVGEVVKGLFGGHAGASALTAGSALLNNLFLLIFSVIAVFPIGKKLHEQLSRYAEITDRGWIRNGIRICTAVIPVLLLILSVLALVGDSYNPFLYFQF